MIWRLLLIFASGLAGGYLLEFLYRSFTNKKMIRPLLINAQMYGLSAVFLYLLPLFAASLILKAVVILAFTTGLEFAVGYSYFAAKGIRLWDYSGYALNYQGFVCARFSLYWLVLSLLYFYVVLPVVL